jgi:hypothetical protein
MIVRIMYTQIMFELFIFRREYCNCSASSARYTDPQREMLESGLYTQYVDSFASDLKELYRLNGWAFHSELGGACCLRTHWGKLNEEP